MLGPESSEVNNIYEVRFKNTRKEFYRNVNGLQLYIGDTVVVESDRGYDVGTLSLGGIMARLQMKKKNFKEKPESLPKIYRKANERDVELLQLVRGRELETRKRTREIIAELNLDMKLSDVEYQADNAKAIFYYIADHRVDFRDLIKFLAREFRIRVEMKQIGLRHEAGLVGGIGSCGRELCCATWLTEFKTVSTAAARYQNLSLNPMKISGLCGRLKCCLNFELDTYMDALKDFPKTETIETHRGKAILQKTDIFKGKMWFSYPHETTWYPLDVAEVKKIVEMNKAGEKPEALALISPPEQIPDIDREMDFVDGVGTDKPQPDARPRRKKRNDANRGKKGEDGQQRQNRKPPRNREAAAGEEQQVPRRRNEGGTQQPPRRKNEDGTPQAPKKKSEDGAQNPTGGQRKSRGTRNNRGRNNRGGQGNDRNRDSRNNDRNKGSAPKTD